MALTSDLAAELDAQEELLQSALREMSVTTQTNSTEIAELRRRREAVLQEATHTLLPDLRTTTIARLQSLVPGIATPEEIARTVNETRSTLEAQLAAARREYDPSRFESQRLELETTLEMTRSSLSDVQQPFDALARNTAIHALIEKRYGTPYYKGRWWRFLVGDMQYYRDWEAGDVVLEKAGTEDWSVVESQYLARKEAIRTFSEQVAALSEQLKALAHAKTTCEELPVAIGNVEQSVLERFRTKLLSRLEEMDRPPAAEKGLRRIEEQIKTLQDQSTRLHEARAQMTEQLMRLQDLRRRVERSNKQSVPDAYLENVRAARPQAAPTEVLPIVYVQDSYDWTGLDLYFPTRVEAQDRPRDRWDRDRHGQS